ncbi:UNVERIFIED_ORG: ferredoxin [Nocardia globerula]|uniref:Ferredoxin n=1 Tax=Nocardia globerula TaxID=1818 RepID=A0A652YSR8_NOCGL|nr:ferredoxin [Rhodococcus globerulus]NMD61356.1 ferredoxin [Nocardia globerula]PVX67093.1 ferredoxin [Rhodococcus globerulus]
MKVRVDNAKCQGHAQCAAMSDDFFELDDLGFIVTVSGAVPVGSEDRARLGADACPERVVSVKD